MFLSTKWRFRWKVSKYLFTEIIYRNFRWFDKKPTEHLFTENFRTEHFAVNVLYYIYYIYIVILIANTPIRHAWIIPLRHLNYSVKVTCAGINEACLRQPKSVTAVNYIDHKYFRTACVNYSVKVTSQDN